MKKFLCLLLIFSITTNLFSQQISSKGKLEELFYKDSNSYNEFPAYEFYEISKNYKINQTIKGAIRWGTVGALAGAGMFLIFPDEMGFGLIVYPIALGTLSGMTGSAIGFHKGKQYNEIKRHDSNFHLKRNRFGFEFKPGEISNFSNTKRTFGVYLTSRNPQLFFDVIRVGYIEADWDGEWYEKDDEIDDYWYFAREKKYEINGIKFLTKQIISPYIGVGIGNSKGYDKFLYLHNLWDEKGGPFRNDVSGLYLRPFIGLNFNFLDFAFMRIEYDYEFSTFYKKINKYNDYPTSAKQMININFGTYIF